MILKLYKTDDDLNVINKTLALVSELTVRLPREIDISNFDLVIKEGGGLDLELVNYAEMVDLNRKYFVERCVNLGGNLWRLTLDCDVLETYKNSILTSMASFKRSAGVGDYVNFSENLGAVSEVDLYYSNVELTKASNMVLSTIGVNE